MSVVYEVVKDGARLHGGTFFTHKQMAEKHADELNHSVISNIMLEANKLPGAIRGANKQRFREMIDEVAKPPYTVVRQSVNSRWG
jgi:hypothetical protein